VFSKTEDEEDKKCLSKTFLSNFSAGFNCVFAGQFKNWS